MLVVVHRAGIHRHPGRYRKTSTSYGRAVDVAARARCPNCQGHVTTIHSAPVTSYGATPASQAEIAGNLLSIAYLFVRRVAPASIICTTHLNAHLDFNEDLFGSIGYSDERMVDFQFA